MKILRADVSSTEDSRFNAQFIFKLKTQSSALLKILGTDLLKILGTAFLQTPHGLVEEPFIEIGCFRCSLFNIYKLLLIFSAIYCFDIENYFSVHLKGFFTFHACFLCNMYEKGV